MARKMAENEMLDTLKRIESLLVTIANNTSPPGSGVLVYRTDDPEGDSEMFAGLPEKYQATTIRR